MAAAVLWMAGVFLLTFTVSLALVCVLIVVLPPRYFMEGDGQFLTRQPPLVRWLGIIGKNLLGLILIVLGAVLSIPGVPGQGLLTILIGVMLLSIPGKRRFMRAIVRGPGVLRKLNRLRSWFGRPPLVVD